MAMSVLNQVQSLFKWYIIRSPHSTLYNRLEIQWNESWPELMLQNSAIMLTLKTPNWANSNCRPFSKPDLLYSTRHSDPQNHQLSDWVVVLRPTRHKIGHFWDVSPSQSLGAVWKKLNVTQQKHAFIHQKKCTTTQNNKKLKPSLVAFYDIRPGNGAGLLSKEKISKGGDK